jgi:hypothetical protein
VKGLLSLFGCDNMSLTLLKSRDNMSRLIPERSGKRVHQRVSRFALGFQILPVTIAGDPKVQRLGLVQRQHLHRVHMDNQGQLPLSTSFVY